MSLSNPDAERSTVGGLMLEPTAAADVLMHARADHFTDPKLSLVMHAVEGLTERGQTFDTVSVTDFLRKQGKTPPGAAFLEGLYDVPSAANVVHHAKIVAECANRRNLRACGLQIVKSSENPAMASTEIAQRGSTDLLEITCGNDRTGPLAARGYRKPTLELLEQRRSKTDTSLLTGLQDLDRKLGGLRRKEVMVLAGRPSMGKTALGFNIGTNAAIEQEKSVLLVSLEMSDQACYERVICAEGRLDSSRMRQGQFWEGEEKRMGKAMDALDRSLLFIDDRSTSLMEIQAHARRLKMQRGLDLVIVDYLQLVSNSGSNNREQEISGISRGLKHLARELDLHVIALSQLNRSVESRDNKRPRLSDLRESGAIEQDADVVCMLYRDDYYYPESPDRGIAEVDVAKHRNGPTGKVKLRWEPNYTLFQSLVSNDNHVPSRSQVPTQLPFTGGTL